MGASPELLELVAVRFGALGEPARLRILNVLRDGERTVTELENTGLGQADVLKHLQMLHALGFVARQKEGLYVYYSLASEDVFRLCDIVCGRLAAEADARGRMLKGARSSNDPLLKDRRRSEMSQGSHAPLSATRTPPGSAPAARRSAPMRELRGGKEVSRALQHDAQRVDRSQGILR